MSDKSGINRKSILRRNRAIRAWSDVNSTWSSSLVYAGELSFFIDMAFFAGSLSRLVDDSEKEKRSCAEKAAGSR